MKRIFLSILFSGTIAAWGSTYYVDFSSGVNTNTGLSASSAWKNCPGDNGASGVAAATSLKAGDKVLFRGGVTYKGMITVRASGTAGAPIAYDGNTAGTYGTGRAVIDGENTRYNGFSGSGVSYVTISGFEILNLPFNATAPWGSGSGIALNSASYCTIANCYMHDIGYWKNDGSTYPAGYGLTMISPRNCVVTGCEVTKTGGTGLSFNGAQNCTISKNNIHDYMFWGVDLGGDYQLCTGNDVCDNTIHDLYEMDAGFWGGTDGPPHTDYVFIRMGSGQHPVKNIVERNLFYNNYTFTQAGGTAMVFLSYADSTIIRNNVFINPHEYYAAFPGWTSAGTKFYNNTIYAPRTGGLELQSNGNNDIRNNIIIAGGQIGYETATDLNRMVCDYNLYFCAVDRQSFVQISPYTARTFDVWKTLGYDAHSKKMAAIADIKFVNTNGYPTACQTMDLHLQPTSPAVNAGTPIPDVSNDKDLKARAGSTWSVGAYQQGSATAVLGSQNSGEKLANRGASPSAKIEPTLLTRNAVASLMGSHEYKIFDASGRMAGINTLHTNGLYLLQNIKSMETRKIVVRD